ncbi:DUF1835 domain-containing protein [Ekhidna sp.]|jgi:hypothetical protein|uniref:DUF1835 domain-containing protein n=1 Tax=Ekhidna sp. TaxID=2608089 RepID=UPI0032F05D91
MHAYHILNGDSLKDRFPTDQIEGEIIIARECMVDGPVNAKSLTDLFQLRKKFMSDAYGLGDYAKQTIPEISKITDIESGEVNLWFEDDLFCQTNLWFVCSLIYQKDVKVYLIRPYSSLGYGFGGLDNDGLVKAFDDRKSVTPIQVNQLALLWFAFRNDDIERLLKLGVQTHADFPFIMRAIEAHFDRTSDGPNQPERIIKQIIQEKSTTDFGKVFREFHKRAPIFGFGDLQFRRIFDRVVDSDQSNS